MKRGYPFGDAVFERIRRCNLAYVDKTGYLKDLIELDQPIFLSRPGRFGKSLFLSMAKAYFEGRQELFEGLAIAKETDEWTRHPVILLE